MIYLASVYSLNADEHLMQKRYEFVRGVIAEFLNNGVSVFSPIVHCHEVAKHHHLPKDWSFWKKVDLDYLSSCTDLFVLRMDGWKDSVGIRAEIDFARENGIPVTFIPVVGETKEKK